MGVQQSKDELLYTEVMSGNQERVKALRRAGAGLEWMDKEGRTPLILACTRGDLLEMAITLISLGANIHSYKPGAHGGTPLHHAAKRGLDKTVIMLLSHGANPLTINDNCQTPLDMARSKDHVTVVRIIEGRICLFSGMIRELSGPGFLEALASQWLSKKIWAVVLPSISHKPRRPPKFELAIYPTPKHSRPRTIISLSKVEIEEPKFDLPDPVLLLFDKGTKSRYKFLSEFEGDKQQLRRLYEACKGIRMPQNEVNTPVVWGGPPLQPNLPATPPANMPLPEDVELAMAIAASMQFASQEGNPPVSEQASTSDLNGRPNISECGVPPDRTTVPSNNDKTAGWSGEVGSTSCNGWAADKARPSSSSTAETLTNDPTVSRPSVSANSVAVPAAACSPSAPPLPAEEVLGPIIYPSIDFSPNEHDFLSTSEHGTQSLASSSKAGGDTSGTCIICWDAPSEGVCIPCGHLAGCMSCLNEIKVKNWGCPVCRASIEQVIRVYTV